MGKSAYIFICQSVSFSCSLGSMSGWLHVCMFKNSIFCLYCNFTIVVLHPLLPTHWPFIHVSKCVKMIIGAYSHLSCQLKCLKWKVCLLSSWVGIHMSVQLPYIPCMPSFVMNLYSHIDILVFKSFLFEWILIYSQVSIYTTESILVILYHYFLDSNFFLGSSLFVWSSVKSMLWECSNKNTVYVQVCVCVCTLKVSVCVYM